MKSKIYSSDYVKTTSKGQYWIPAFIAVGFLLAFPVAELIMLGNWMGIDYEAAQLLSLYENLWKDGLLITGTVIAALAGTLNAVSGFWYLYSSRKVDFYHSLPVKRSHMFWHRVYVGLLYYIVPYFVMEFMAVCIGAMRGYFSLYLMKLAFILLVLHLLMYLLFYFAAVLVITMTGNILMGALCLFGIHAYGPALAILITAGQKTFFDNYLSYIYGVPEILLKSSPTALAVTFIEKYAEKDCLHLFLIIVAVTVLLGAGAYFAYLGRRPEKTGRALVYRACEPIIGVLVTVPVGLGVGHIFYMLPRREVVAPWWIFGLLLGTVLAHGILQVIYNMDFRKFVSNKIQFCVNVLLVAVVALGFKMDVMGFDTYIPAYDKLESIYIDFQNVGMFENMERVEPDGEGKYIFNAHQDDEYWGLVNKDVGKSTGIYEALGAIVSRGGENTESGSYEPISVKYVTTSKKAAYREYMVSTRELKNLLNACYEEGTVQENRYSFLQIDPQYLNWVTAGFYDGKNYGLFQDERDKWVELIQALREDVKEASSEVLTGLPCAELSFEYEDVPLSKEQEQKASLFENTRYFSARIYVYPQFKRTVALLKETGYPMSMNEVPVEEVKIRCDKVYRMDKTRDEGKIYTDAEEISALKQCMVPYDFGVPWLPIETSCVVVAKTKDGTEELYLDLLSDRLPDFVKEYIQEFTEGW